MDPDEVSSKTEARTSDGVRTRHLWSPAIHSIFEERCYFFLLSTVTCRGQDLGDKLSVEFRRLGIHGVTTHVVLGPMDLLVRAWMTPEKRRAFFDRILDEADWLQLDQIFEFSTISVEYKWLNAADEYRQSELHETLRLQLENGGLRSRLQGLVTDDNFPRDDAVEELVASGVLIEAMDEFSADTQKLYMFLTAEKDDRPRLHDQVADAAVAAGLSQVSVYRGDGFCDFVLKGLHSGPGVMTAISSIQQQLAHSDISGWSLLPPTFSEEEQSEAVDALRSQPADDLAESLSEMRREDVVSASDIATSLQDSRTFERVNSFIASMEDELPILPGIPNLNDRVRRRMESLLAGILAGSRKRVNREVSFLVTGLDDAREIMKVLAAEMGPLAEEVSHFDEGASLTEMVRHLLELFSSTKFGDLLDSYLEVEEAISLASSVDDALSRHLAGVLFGDVLERNFAPSVEDDLQLVKKAAILQIGLEGLRLHLLDSLD